MQQPELKQPVEHIEKKSRFIGYAQRVQTADEAKAFIARVAGQHKKAGHVTYAYILSGQSGQGAIGQEVSLRTVKMSDDGEPKGTAGLPIYSIIEKRGMTDVCVVVVRYFGGVLLGKGGLIRAYGKTAGAVLETL